ncbi:MAG: hypothetical protein LBJ12_02840 [Oscillospiraceae bacterium]|jgi:hypothetical protein|nr:hypothetical protein [Oscillospiraceae bacterium]
MKKKLFPTIISMALVVAIGVTAFYFIQGKNRQEADGVVSTEETEALALSVFPPIPQSQFVGVIEGSAYIAIDPEDSDKVLANASCVVRALVTSAGEAHFHEQNEPYPSTPLTLKILEVLSGDISEKTIVVDFPASSVSVDKFIESHLVESEKIGLKKLTQKERKSQYIKFEFEVDWNYDIKTNTEYIIMLKEYDNETYCVNGNYYVDLGGYSMFTKDKKNVKTQKELKSTKAGKAKVATITAAE